jgi:ferredoxin
MSLPHPSGFEVEIVAVLPQHDISRSSPPAGRISDLNRRVAAMAGETLLKALQRIGAPIISVCGGQASCGACRVEIEAGSLAGLPPANKTEAMLLEFLDNPAPGHRLACQLALTPALHGLRLTLAP